MKNIVLIFFLVFSIASCSSNTNQLQERITDADSIAINYFKGDGTMDTVVAVKIIRDSISIKQLTDFVTESQALYKTGCGYDGSLHFFRNNFVVQDIFFSSSKEDCQQFSFTQEGKQTATKLSADAKKLLQSLKAK